MNLNEMLDYVIEKTTGDRESISLHPSALRTCDRKMMFSCQGAEKSHPMSPETSWMLSRFGTYEALFKKGLQAFAGHNVLDLREQYELRWLAFHGYVDFALLGKENILVEIKSSKPSAFGRGSMPYESHLAQAQAYYIMAHESGVQSMPDKVVILYISRWYDGKLPEFAIFDVTPTEEEYDELKAYMEALDELRKEKIIPDRPFEHAEEHPWLCTRWNWKAKEREISCPYYDLCWKDALPL